MRFVQKLIIKFNQIYYFQTLVEMLWMTQAYMYENRTRIKDLIKVLDNVQKK